MKWQSKQRIKQQIKQEIPNPWFKSFIRPCSIHDKFILLPWRMPERFSLVFQEKHFFFHPSTRKYSHQSCKTINFFLWLTFWSENIFLFIWLQQIRDSVETARSVDKQSQTIEQQINKLTQINAKMVFLLLKIFHLYRKKGKRSVTVFFS